MGTSRGRPKARVGHRDPRTSDTIGAHVGHGADTITYAGIPTGTETGAEGRALGREALKGALTQDQRSATMRIRPEGRQTEGVDGESFAVLLQER